LLFWLNGHKTDAPCAGLCEVSGVFGKIVRLTNGDFGFVH
jgi:hypothetical protein